MRPRHSIGPGIAGRIENRVRGLVGEKVPRRRYWPSNARWPPCLDTPESVCVRIWDKDWRREPQIFTLTRKT